MRCLFSGCFLVLLFFSSCLAFADSVLTVDLAEQRGFDEVAGSDFKFHNPAGMKISKMDVNWRGSHPGTKDKVPLGLRHENVSTFETSSYDITAVNSLEDFRGEGVTSTPPLTFPIRSSKSIRPWELIDCKGPDCGTHFSDDDGSQCTRYSTATVPEPPVTALLVVSALVFGGFLRREIARSA